MKKNLSRLKTGLAALWVTIISFFSKVMGQSEHVSLYGVPGYSIEAKPTLIDIVIKISNGIVRWITIPLLLIVGIVNIKKIRKISDKVERKKKIKRTIVTLLLILILTVILFILLRLLVRFLIKNDSTY